MVTGLGGELLRGAAKTFLGLLAKWGGKLLANAADKQRIEEALWVALDQSFAAFSTQYPAFHTGKMDKNFLDRVVAAAALKFLAPGEAPDPGNLAAAYHTLNPHITVEMGTTAFEWLLRNIHEELAKQPDLAELVHLQHGAAAWRNTEELLPLAADTNSTVHEIRRMLERPLFLPEALPRIREVFGRKSAALLEWPQSLCTGDWIERPEEQKLHEFLTDDATRLVLLLGPAGSGKSALMARLATGLRLQGTTFLALKADTLSREVGTLAALQADLEMPESLVACLERLADEGPVVLFVDQLDALCELMVTKHSERLSVLLNVIREAFFLRHRNLKVIASTRTFEATRIGGFAGEVAAIVMEEALSHLESP